MTPELNESNFAPTIEKESAILVEFFATWCPHCQHMQSLVDQLAHSGKIPVYQVDVDQSPDLANTYAPQGYPTFVLFVNGKPHGSLVGEQSLEGLQNFIAAR